MTETNMKTKPTSKRIKKAVRTRPQRKRSFDEMSPRQIMVEIMRVGASVKPHEDRARIAELAYGKGGLRPGVNLKDEIAECSDYFYSKTDLKPPMDTDK